MQAPLHAGRQRRLSILMSVICLGLIAEGAASAQIAQARGSYLGIRLVELDAERARELNLDPARGGVEVTLVRPDSPASAAGLQVGDVILSYNQDALSTAQQLLRLVEETPPGHRVALRYVRAGKLQTAILTTAPRPTDLSMDATRDYPMMPAEIPAPLLVWRNTILGLECETLNPQLAAFFGTPQGVLVRYVEKDSRSDSAGFRAGDVIIAAGDRPVVKPRDLTAALREGAASGKEIKFAVVREHRHTVVPVSLNQ